MAIAPISVEFRGTRRVRTIFTGALASGAFTSTSYYAITADDGGANPMNVLAVFAIANTPNAVEFAVDSDLTQGALYTVGFTAVPGADASTFTGTVDSRVALALTQLANVEPETQDIDPALYGRDLSFLGDYLEDPSGDLLTTTGRKNWIGAIGRRIASDGLKWDPTYGPDTDQAVEGPAVLAPAFAGSLVAQARLDDRTKQATVSLTQAPNDPAGFMFAVRLVGTDGLPPPILNVSPPTT
jgi:hypothetical protein